MPTWLKLIGSAKKPITEQPFYGNYNAEHVGFRKTRKPGIRSGDHLFLYAPGGRRRIFALAQAIADPERDADYNSKEEGSCRWKLRVRYLINLPVSCGILIDDVTSGRRELTRSVRRASHIKLLPQESQLADRKFMGLLNLLRSPACHGGKAAEFRYLLPLDESLGDEDDEIPL